MADSWIPLSDARSESWSVQAWTEATRKRKRTCTASSKHHKDEPIANSFFQDANHHPLTHQHPSVFHCLAYARRAWSLPTTTPETILAICAMEVFFHPSDPVHWLFWSNERKTESVEMLNRVCSESPPLIKPSRMWDESMLFSLAQLHGQAWHNTLRDKPWYSALVGTKEPESTYKGPNLRKRKPPAVNPNTHTEDVSDHVPSKRTRLSSPRNTSPPSSERPSSSPIPTPSSTEDTHTQPKYTRIRRRALLDLSKVGSRSPSVSASVPLPQQPLATRSSPSSSVTAVGSDRSLSPLSDLTTVVGTNDDDDDDEKEEEKEEPIPKKRGRKAKSRPKTSVEQKKCSTQPISTRARTRSRVMKSLS